jgi:hypothetical protein
MLGVLLVDLFNRGFNINQLHCVGQYINNNNNNTAERAVISFA